MEYEKTGKFIQELRKERNLTQRALSDILGVTDQAVSKWERGKSFPDVSMLKPLGEALGVSVSELLDGERRSFDNGSGAADGAVTLTIEEADETAIRGIRAYIHETQRRDRVGMVIFLIALLMLAFTAREVFQGNRGSVDFQNGNLDFDGVRVVMEDESTQWISLEDPRGAELKDQIQRVLREEMPDAEEVGELKVLPRKSAKGPYVKLDGLITLYSGVYYDQRSWEYYTFPHIEEVHQKIYSMCRDWLAADEG